jgi:hypothetical protein
MMFMQGTADDVEYVPQDLQPKSINPPEVSCVDGVHGCHIFFGSLNNRLDGVMDLWRMAIEASFCPAKPP